jgi:DNA polymerase IV
MLEQRINDAPPQVMHVDMNSCFATCEQQANPLLRGRPVGIAAYTTARGCIVSPSYEAKAMGVKVGMQVQEGRALCPDIYIKEPNPPLYRFMHMEMRKIFADFSPEVSFPSIDEGIISFKGTPALSRGLENVGMEIKERFRNELGVWMRCNVGIGPNRFLAKTAAGLHKPDGLDVITHRNLRQVFAGMELTDLCGIAGRNKARLNSAGIYTPLEFLASDPQTLQKRVFQSVNGLHWYRRLRGYEVDDIDYGRKSFGSMYSLPKKLEPGRELDATLMKMCERVGYLMRKQGYYSKGVHVSVVYEDWTMWHRGKVSEGDIYATAEIYKACQRLLSSQPGRAKIAKLSVSCFDLRVMRREQLRLFHDQQETLWDLTEAIDKVNSRYGMFVLTPALMMGMDDVVIDRISFGGVKDLDDLAVN